MQYFIRRLFSSINPFEKIVFNSSTNMNGRNNLIFNITPTNLDIMAKNGAEIIKSGGIIAVPTDTIYGIAADAQDPEAISKIYKIKGRDFSKPIAICVANIKQIYDWGQVSIPESALKELLPGPITLVFKRQSTLNPSLNPATNLIGIRIPDHQFIQQLSYTYGNPIALTSANPSSALSTLHPDEFKSLWSSLDGIFDGGRISLDDSSRAGSTVIDLSKSGTYKIIRKGNEVDKYINILEKKYHLTEEC